MTTIFDKIKYDHKKYSELTDPIGKNEIEKLVSKLKPIEAEIINDPNGSITIMKSGNVFQDSFNSQLSEQISKLIN